MRGSERRQIAALRRAVDAIQASRAPVPAHVAGDFHRAVGSLQVWEDMADQDQLGLLPFLGIALGAVGIMALWAIAVVIGKTTRSMAEAGAETAGAVGEAARKGAEAVGNIAPWIVYGLTGLMFYNLASKGKLL